MVAFDKDLALGLEQVQLLALLPNLVQLSGEALHPLGVFGVGRDCVEVPQVPEVDDRVGPEVPSHIHHQLPRPLIVEWNVGIGNDEELLDLALYGHALSSMTTG